MSTDPQLYRKFYPLLRPCFQKDTTADQFVKQAFTTESMILEEWKGEVDLAALQTQVLFETTDCANIMREYEFVAVLKAFIDHGTLPDWDDDDDS